MRSRRKQAGRAGCKRGSACQAIARQAQEGGRTILGVESEMRPARDSAEKPANTTENTAPMRAHASMTAGSCSGGGGRGLERAREQASEQQVGKRDESGHMAMPQRQADAGVQPGMWAALPRPGLARQKSGAVRCAPRGSWACRW